MYLAGVRSLHVAHGHHFTFNQQLTPQLQQVLKGIRKQQAIGSAPRIRQPIIIQIMAGIKSILLKNPHDYHNIMMWAACCLAFFGFLRCSEFTVPSQGTYDSQVHLLPKDIAVDNQANPQLLRVVIKQSKTDPFRQGASLYLGKTDSFVCPVTGILPFLAVRENQDGPLFMLKDGRMLTRQLFSTFLDNILSKFKLNQSYILTLTASRLELPPPLRRLEWMTFISRCWEDGEAIPTSNTFAHPQSNLQDFPKLSQSLVRHQNMQFFSFCLITFHYILLLHYVILHICI